DRPRPERGKRRAELRVPNRGVGGGPHGPQLASQDDRARGGEPGAGGAAGAAGAGRRRGRARTDRTRAPRRDRAQRVDDRRPGGRSRARARGRRVTGARCALRNRGDRSGDGGRDAPAARRPPPCRRWARARAATGPARPRVARRARARGRPAGRAQLRGRAGCATARHRAFCIPDRPGVADERPQARRPGERGGDGALRDGSGRARDPRRRRRLRPRRRDRPRPGRDARKGRPLGWTPRRGEPRGRRLGRARAAARREQRGVIRGLLADDQALVRAGFRLIVDAEPDMEVVGEAADGSEVVEQASATNPDVVLMDVRMPNLDGIEATRRLLASGDGPRVLMLTTFDLDEYVIDAFRAGASGFLLKTAPPDQLVGAVRTVHSGEALLAPASTRRLIEQFARQSGAAPALDELTARERDVLRLLARGLTNAE